MKVERRELGSMAEQRGELLRERDRGSRRERWSCSWRGSCRDRGNTWKVGVRKVTGIVVGREERSANICPFCP